MLERIHFILKEKLKQNELCTKNYAEQATIKAILIMDSKLLQTR